MFLDGPAQNGDNRAEALLSPSNVGQLHVKRVFANWVPDPGTLSYQVIVGGYGYSVVGGQNGLRNSYVAAFNLSSGQRVWRHLLGTAIFRPAPAVIGGVLFVGGYGTMFAYNAVTGVSVWSTNVGNFTGGFNVTTVAAGIVYASTYGGTVYAFNAADGRILWSRAPSGCCLTGPVSVSGGLAYVVTDHLTAYNALTGATVFSSPVKLQAEDAAVSGGLAFVQGFVSGNTFKFDAFDASTGALRWSRPFSCPPVTDCAGAPLVDGNTVVIGTQQDTIEAVSASTGMLLWTGYGAFTSAIANGVVYVEDSHLLLVALDESTGRMLFKGTYPCTESVVSHGAVFANCATPQSNYYAVTEYGV